MKILALAAAFGALVMSAMPAAAQIDYRQDRQQQRIERGIRSGEITRREGRQLGQQQRRIGRAESRARYSGGRLTFQERRRLQQRQNRASRNIHRQRHDRQDYRRRY